MNINVVLRFCGLIYFGCFGWISVSNAQVPVGEEISQQIPVIVNEDLDQITTLADSVENASKGPREAKILSSADEVFEFAKSEVESFFADEAHRDLRILNIPEMGSGWYWDESFYLARFYASPPANSSETATEIEVVSEVRKSGESYYQRLYDSENDKETWRKIDGSKISSVQNLNSFELEIPLSYGVLCESVVTRPTKVNQSNFGQYLEEYCSHIRSALESRYPANKTVDQKLGLEDSKLMQLPKLSSSAEYGNTGKIVAAVAIGGLSLLTCGWLIYHRVSRADVKIH
ncbi:MAG: hypothetical protein LBJ77_00950 [Holosporales bacterium]|nr:hypothetical protein [Holosporales bacterium]